MQCQMCGGCLSYLGVLGYLTWWVCRDCGMQSFTECNKIEVLDE